MTYSSGILLDCDYIIALSIDNESTHLAAKTVRRTIIDIPQFILRPITYELATVVSRKFGHVIASAMLKDLENSDIKRLEIDDFEPDIWKEFHSQTRKGTSFFDCANLVAAKHYALKIASFNQFYPKNLRVT